MELLGLLDHDVLDVASSKFEVVILWVLRKDETQLIVAKGCYDLVEDLCLGKVKLFRVDEHQFVFEEFGRKHARESDDSLLVVNWEFKTARDWTMGNTTTLSLRCSLVSLSGSSTTFLWRWFDTRALNITDCLRSLPDRLAFMLEVLEHVVYDVSAKWLVPDFLIELNDFTGWVATDQVKYRDFHLAFERPL